MNRLKVVLNVSQLQVPELLNKARLIVQNITANTTVFATPNPATAAITTACDDLENLARDASDGSKTKIALRNDKQSKLIQLLTQLAAYVEQIADGDEEVVHLAGLDVKKRGMVAFPDFMVRQGKERGSAFLKVKPRVKTVYKWQHSPDNGATWITDGMTDICKTTLYQLQKGIYLFRVVLIDASGEHEQTPLSVAIN